MLVPFDCEALVMVCLSRKTEVVRVQGNRLALMLYCTGPRPGHLRSDSKMLVSSFPCHIKEIHSSSAHSSTDKDNLYANKGIFKRIISSYNLADVKLVIFRLPILQQV